MKKDSFICRSKDRWILKFKRGGAWKMHRCPKDVVRTERDAERYGETWLSELDRQGGIEPETTGIRTRDRGPTLNDLRDPWLKLRQRDSRLAPLTTKDNKTQLLNHILPKLGRFHVSEIEPVTLRKFLRELREEGLAPYSILNIAHCFSRLIDDSMAEGWTGIPANPWRHPAVRRELPRAKTRAGKVIVHLRREDAERLLTTELPEVWRTRYLLGALTGLRDGELSGLKWSDVDLDAIISVIHVRRAVVYKGELGHASIGRLKTDAAERDAPLHSLVVDALRSWKSEGWTQCVGRKPSGDDFVLPNCNGAAWRPASARILRGHLEAAGVATSQSGFPVTFHAIRRSFATWLTAAEVPDALVKQLMGHAGTGVTARHYTAHELGAMRRAVERITLDLRRVAPPLLQVVGQ